MSATDGQCGRVQAWLETHESTTIADWDRQPACDGGDKITRLAARIGDLKTKRGLSIDSRLVPLGETRVAEYRLNPKSSRQPAPDTLAASLFSTPRSAIDDDWDWTAAA